MTDNVTSGPASAHNEHASSTTDRPIRVGIMTCSDRGARGERADVSGPTLHNLVVDHLSGQVVQYRVVPDERTPIEATLKEWADEHKLDLILTTGGTGLSPRDVTPDATRAVCDREVPAIAQAMFLESLRITPYAMLTRATAGIRRRTLIVNLPGNPRAVQENFGAIAEVLPHAIDIIRGVDTHASHAGH
ncbi:MAG: MogA/MoaB family molybdenum cofactor biosynthesis protein, partial [Chloroflexi bacterium]|nr:MogA/MoaB family molybdenum cofactor biosynthesis protein [Chloroflexota bacterium]